MMRLGSLAVAILASAILSASPARVVRSDRPDTLDVDLPSRDDRSSPRDPDSTPILPPRTGCYNLEGRVWRDTPCVDPAVHARQYPDAKAFPLPGWMVKNFTVAADQTQPKIAWSKVSVSIGAVGTSKDTLAGNGFWSVQNNTNGFPGTNGVYDVVQFTTQSSPYTGDDVCIDEINMKTGDYFTYKVCVNAKRSKTRMLQAGDKAVITGYAYVGKTGNHLIGIVATLPWAMNHKQVGVVVDDHFGLYRRWIAVSGGILGFGGSSGLVFDKAIATTAIEAVGCWPTSLSMPDCKTGHPLRKFAQPVLYEITEETNNLTKVPVAVPKPYFWDPLDYVGRAVIHATAGACYAAVKKGGAKTTAC